MVINLFALCKISPETKMEVDDEKNQKEVKK